MGLREKLNAKPALAAGVFGGLILVAIVVMAVGKSSSGTTVGKAYFSTDDGVTWFADDVAKIPPFDHDGKDAVRAYVVECDGKQQVAYLERFTPAKRAFAQAMEDAAKGKQPPPKLPPNSTFTNWGDEVKKPGDKSWTAESDLKSASKIMTFKCPDGSEAMRITP